MQVNRLLVSDFFADREELIQIQSRKRRVRRRLNERRAEQREDLSGMRRIGDARAVRRRRQRGLNKPQVGLKCGSTLHRLPRAQLDPEDEAIPRKHRAYRAQRASRRCLQGERLTWQEFSHDNRYGLPEPALRRFGRRLRRSFANSPSRNLRLKFFKYALLRPAMNSQE